MQGYVIRRVLALIPTLIFASFIVFITVRMIPGNIIDLMLSQNDVSACEADAARSWKWRSVSISPFSSSISAGSAR